MIQETRRYILDILKTNGDSTVDEIVISLHEMTEKHVTAATVRHHLDILQKDGLVNAPTVRRRDTPGRPQYVYHLTEKARDYFPTNYANLASSLLSQIKGTLPLQSINSILEGVASDLSSQAEIPEGSLEERLDYVVEFLSEHGYQADWQEANGRDGYLLRTSNCPFERLSETHDEVCVIDIHLVTRLLGVMPRRLGRLADGDIACAYYIPRSEERMLARG
jgi:DeoR family suf operon transcriptional repressor